MESRITKYEAGNVALVCRLWHTAMSAIHLYFFLLIPSNRGSSSADQYDHVCAALVPVLWRGTKSPMDGTENYDLVLTGISEV
jgi:hypothetical protein